MAVFSLLSPITFRRSTISRPPASGCPRGAIEVTNAFRRSLPAATTLLPGNSPEAPSPLPFTAFRPLPLSRPAFGSGLQLTGHHCLSAAFGHCHKRLAPLSFEFFRGHHYPFGGVSATATHSQTSITTMIDPVSPLPFGVSATATRQLPALSACCFDVSIAFRRFGHCHWNLNTWTSYLPGNVTIAFRRFGHCHVNAGALTLSPPVKSPLPFGVSATATDRIPRAVAATFGHHCLPTFRPLPLADFRHGRDFIRRRHHCLSGVSATATPPVRSGKAALMSHHCLSAFRPLPRCF